MGRRASELCDAEASKLLGALRSFSDRWYQHCQHSDNGQLMGCCHLMRIYGHHNCVACGGTVNLIKEGVRQRITYFCPACQPSTLSALDLSTLRPHRQQMVLKLPRCSC